MKTKSLITNTGRGLAYLALASGFAGCNSGCNPTYQPLQAEQAPKQITQNYFAQIPAYEGGLSSTPGDFNEDGHLDLVLGGIAGAGGLSTSGYFYFYAGDGKGNFTLKSTTVTK